MHDETLTDIFSRWLNQIAAQRVGRLREDEDSYIVLQQLEENMDATFETALDRLDMAMEKLRAEGREAGIKQGVKQGIQQGKTTLLKTLIQQKFGITYDPSIEERITSAAPEELDLWAGALS